MGLSIYDEERLRAALARETAARAAAEAKLAAYETALQRIHDECLKNGVAGIGNIALTALDAALSAGRAQTGGGGENGA